MNRREVTTDKGTAIVWQASIAQALPKLRQTHIQWGAVNGWASGSETPAMAMEYARTGNAALVPMAEAFLDQITADVETARAEWVPSPVGAFPIVPDYLSGRPDSMRRRVQVDSPMAPVRVMCDLTSSAGVGFEALQKRGAAVLALVMALAQQGRAVELWAGCQLARDTRGGAAGCLMVQLPSHPLHVGVCAHALTSSVWTRQIGYEFLVQTEGTTGSWAWTVPNSPREMARYVSLSRQTLSMGPQDVFVPPVFITDPIIANPVEWVNNALSTAQQTEEE